MFACFVSSSAFSFPCIPEWARILINKICVFLCIIDFITVLTWYINFDVLAQILGFWIAVSADLLSDTIICSFSSPVLLTSSQARNRAYSSDVNTKEAAGTGVLVFLWHSMRIASRFFFWPICVYLCSVYWVSALHTVKRLGNDKEISVFR